MTDANPSGRFSTFRLRRRTPGSFLLVPCPKQGRSIRCRGQLEAAAAAILIACPRVAHIQEQPLTIWYAWRGREGPVEIQLLDGRKRLVEVKPSSRIARLIVQRKLAVGRAFAVQEGWTFHLVTEKELFQGPLMENVRLLNRYCQGRMDEILLEQLLLQVPAGGIELARLLSSSDPRRTFARPAESLR